MWTHNPHLSVTDRCESESTFSKVGFEGLHQSGDGDVIFTLWVSQIAPLRTNVLQIASKG